MVFVASLSSLVKLSILHRPPDEKVKLGAISVNLLSGQGIDSKCIELTCVHAWHKNKTYTPCNCKCQWKGSDNMDREIVWHVEIGMVACWLVHERACYVYTTGIQLHVCIEVVRHI